MHTHAYTHVCYVFAPRYMFRLTVSSRTTYDVYLYQVFDACDVRLLYFYFLVSRVRFPSIFFLPDVQ